MGLFTQLATVSRLLTVGLSEAPVAAVPDVPSTVPWWMSSRAGRVALDVCLSIPAVRRARHVIAGTSSTFEFIGWHTDGRAVAPTDRRIKWLRQPDRSETLSWTLWRTFDDLMWQDRSVWRIVDRYVDGAVAKADRVHPNRVDTLTNPHDPDRVDVWLIDGVETSRSDLIVMNGAGIGGLQRYGHELLTLYGQLQAAAGRYAEAPHPHAILKNHGADLTDDEISDLLDQWERARSTSSVGYLNDVLDYETFGWNAEELQLTDAREHAALEVARLFGLPAKAVDAKSGDSMTYANAVEARRDIREALRPWHAAVTSALSALSGITVELDAEVYTRDDPQTRMNTWTAALDKNILSLDEVRALEPLAARRHP